LENNKLKVKSRSGHEFEVDTSDEACLKFGCRHGDIIIDPGGDQGAAMGVASGFDFDPKEPGPEELWYILDGEKGVSFWEDSLKDGGFKVKTS
jgi:hypothetical protein